MSALRVLVTGASGRVGRLICEQVEQSGDLVLAQAAHRGDALRAEADVVVDFTAPDATAAYARWCANHGVALVTGTTGLGASHREALALAAKTVPVLSAPNTSLGVNLLISLAARAATALGERADIEVVEAHHRHKKDAPSGTALRLADAVASARGWNLDDVIGGPRRGITGERPSQEVGISVVRGGDVVGEHTVYFLWEGERIELVHRATDRGIFARGALAAARWLAGQPAGLYGMDNVLKCP